jgi:hypothetical protein
MPCPFSVRARESGHPENDYPPVIRVDLGPRLRGDERNESLRPTVMPGLVAGIHVFSALQH